MAAMRGGLEVEMDCPLCQERVVAERDGGVRTGRLYCTQCGEELAGGEGGEGGTGQGGVGRGHGLASLVVAGLGAGARGAAGSGANSGNGDANNGETAGSSGVDTDANHATMAAMLHQALVRGGGDAGGDGEGGIAVPQHLGAVFRTLLPAFQRLMSGEGVGEGDLDPSIFGLGEDFGSGGGAPPASKSAVERLERVVLDAENLEAQTSRITLRWGRPVAVTQQPGSEGESVRLKRDHSSGTMYAEQAEFGPSFVEAPITSPKALVLARPLERRSVLWSLGKGRAARSTTTTTTRITQARSSCAAAVNVASRSRCCAHKMRALPAWWLSIQSRRRGLSP